MHDVQVTVPFSIVVHPGTLSEEPQNVRPDQLSPQIDVHWAGGLPGQTTQSWKPIIRRETDESPSIISRGP